MYISIKGQVVASLIRSTAAGTLAVLPTLSATIPPTILPAVRGLSFYDGACAGLVTVGLCLLLYSVLQEEKTRDAWRPPTSLATALVPGGARVESNLVVSRLNRKGGSTQSFASCVSPG